MTDEEIKNSAFEQAKVLKKNIARELANIEIYPSEPDPISVFMAGSPGAGKTESSRNLIKRIAGNEKAVLRIDSDDLRSRFSEYNGTNSDLFIRATSLLVDVIHDHALSQHQSFVFDGTLTNIDAARKNIERSLKKNRFVQILYVYQEPLQAWEFVKAREQKEGRRIPRGAFIEKYFIARENVNSLKREFGKKIQVDLVIKNIDGTDFSYKENIETIDNYIPEKYTRGDLEKMIL